MFVIQTVLSTSIRDIAMACTGMLDKGRNSSGNSNESESKLKIEITLL